MLTVCMNIDRNEAIRLGLAREGWVTVQLEDEHVAQLQADERELLAKLPTQPGIHVQHEGFVDPTPHGVLAWIANQCAKKRREQEEKEKKEEQRRRVLYDAIRAYLDAGDTKKLLRETHLWAERVGGYCYRRSSNVDFEPVPWDHPMFAKLKKQVDDLAAVLSADAQRLALEQEKQREEREEAEKARVAAQEKARREAVRALITLEDDLARFDAGYMGEKEQKDIVRDELFRRVEELGLSRYNRIKASDVEGHDPDCYDHDIEFETIDEGVELDGEEFKNLVRVRECLKEHGHPDHAAEPLTHMARCKHCGAEHGRTSVLVSFTWHGWDLSREYAL